MRIPKELTELSQWMTWSYNEDGQKIPSGKSNDPDTWKPFEIVQDRSRKAFVFSATDPYCGIDLDDCLDDNCLLDWAVPIIEKFRGIAYAEISPSKTGIKLITRAKKPTGSRCTNSNGVECYDHARFWTITGDLFQHGFDSIGDGQEAIDWLCSTYLQAVKPIAHNQPLRVPKPTRGVDSSDVHRRAAAYVEALSAGTKGDLRNAAFRNAGHLHSIVSDGCRLSEAEVYEYLKIWNQKNAPQLRDDELKEAAENGKKNGTPPPDKYDAVVFTEIEDDFSDVDLSFLLGEEREEDVDDDEFCESMVPTVGFIRELYDYYLRSSYRGCPVFALSTAIAFCQSMFGRKIASETNLRTNDYHLVLAPTTSGKEGPLTAVSKLLVAAGCHESILPEKIQSGNGLLQSIKTQPNSIWVCDEFGYVLSSILDKKNKDANAKAIGQMLLSLYGKSGSVFTGSAYARGVDHAVIQPHLCVLGVSTGHTVFKEISESQVLDGMLGRISIWSVQERPRPNRELDFNIPEKLISRIKSWSNYTPGTATGNLAEINPQPLVLRFTAQARARWQAHEDAIDDHMGRERAIRSSMWGRTAARSMKLALTHRAARIDVTQLNDFSSFEIELCDVEWGIAVSNHCTRLACSLVTETVVDTEGDVLKSKVCYAIEHAGRGVTIRDLQRAIRKSDSGQIRASVTELEREGLVSVAEEKTKGRPKKIITWIEVTESAF